MKNTTRVVVALAMGACNLDSSFQPPGLDAPVLDSMPDASLPDMPTVPAKRFWRLEVISVDKTGGGGSLVLTEIRMKWDGTVHPLATATFSTPDVNPQINPHDSVDVLKDGQLTTAGGTAYVSFDVTGTLDIDLGTAERVTAVLIAPSGFNGGAPNNAPLEWTLGQFQFCSSETGAAPFECHDLDGGARSEWMEATLREFAF